ncbi:MAG: IS110 family transposase [Albidovulum sp.]|jgi:transposase
MLFAGLDVSSARIALCVMNEAGELVCQASIESEPGVIAEELRPWRDQLSLVGLEAGPTSAWLARELRALDLPVTVIDAAHASAALRTGFRNKTDKNDARGIADLMRVRKFRPVHVKSPEAQRDRALLSVREHLRRQGLDLRNAVWSILQAEGLKPPKLTTSRFQQLLVAALEDPDLAPVLTPLVRLIDKTEEEVAELDRQIAKKAKARATCRRLKTIPGVGPLTALTFATGIDDPARFSRSRDVGVHFGLTPRRYQSGDMDWSGSISRAGDAAVRRALYQAANAMIHHSRRWCALKSWAVRLAARRGLKKAKVALARKLAVVMHRMWVDGTDYRVSTAN